MFKHTQLRLVFRRVAKLFSWRRVAKAMWSLLLVHTADHMPRPSCNFVNFFNRDGVNLVVEVDALDVFAVAWKTIKKNKNRTSQRRSTAQMRAIVSLPDLPMIISINSSVDASSRNSTWALWTLYLWISKWPSELIKRLDFVFGQKDTATHSLRICVTVLSGSSPVMN